MSISPELRKELNLTSLEIELLRLCLVLVKPKQKKSFTIKELLNNHKDMFDSKDFNSLEYKFYSRLMKLEYRKYIRYNDKKDNFTFKGDPNDLDFLIEENPLISDTKYDTSYYTKLKLSVDEQLVLDECKKALKDNNTTYFYLEDIPLSSTLPHSKIYKSITSFITLGIVTHCIEKMKLFHTTYSRSYLYRFHDDYVAFMQLPENHPVCNFQAILTIVDKMQTLINLNEEKIHLLQQDTNNLQKELRLLKAYCSRGLS